MTSYYEHHLTIKKNRLCPFKISSADTAFPVPCNWHNNIEIVLVTEGSGMLQYGKSVLSLAPRDIVIINSGTLHRPFSQSGMSYIFIIIDESFCKENGLDTSLLYFTEQLRDELTEKLIRNAFERKKDYFAYSDPLSAARLREAMLSLLIDICERHTRSTDQKTEQSTTSEEYVNKVLDHLNDCYSQPVSLDALAALCGITKYHLAREFKKYTGQTVFTYVNILRCKKAEMMISEGKTVTEAALESGFESPSYFSRTYKKLRGAPPSKSK